TSLLILSALAAVTGGQPFPQPPDAVDMNPDPTIVEVDIEAREALWEFIPGVPTKVWAFNGSIPGPTIRANVGDTVRVHFMNMLSEPSSIHWHGVQVPANMDGAQTTQAMVPPMGMFDYEFKVLTDGLYWYHPHFRSE